MEIFSIVVFPNEETVFSAPGGNWLKKNVHEDYIRKIGTSWTRLVNGTTGIHPIPGPKGFYYGYWDNTQAVVIATDSELDAHSKINLMRKILTTKTREELQNIIDNPLEACKSKPEEILETLEETRKIMIKVIEKVIERGDKISDTQERTEALKQNAIKFKKAAVKLNRPYCPGLFTLFGYAKSFIWKDTYQHEYQPTEKLAPK